MQSVEFGCANHRALLGDVLRHQRACPASRLAKVLGQGRKNPTAVQQQVAVLSGLFEQRQVLGEQHPRQIIGQGLWVVLAELVADSHQKSGSSHTVLEGGCQAVLGGLPVGLQQTKVGAAFEDGVLLPIARRSWWWLNP
jgi:hypothetical protein